MEGGGTSIPTTNNCDHHQIVFYYKRKQISIVIYILSIVIGTGARWWVAVAPSVINIPMNIRFISCLCSQDSLCAMAISS